MTIWSVIEFGLWAMLVSYMGFQVVRAQLALNKARREYRKQVTDDLRQNEA